MAGHPHIKFYFMCPAIKLTVHKVSTSSITARIPPSRRGRSSADISVIPSSSAEAQWTQVQLAFEVYKIIQSDAVETTA